MILSFEHFMRLVEAEEPADRGPVPIALKPVADALRRYHETWANPLVRERMLRELLQACRNFPGRGGRQDGERKISRGMTFSVQALGNGVEFALRDRGPDSVDEVLGWRIMSLDAFLTASRSEQPLPKKFSVTLSDLRLIQDILPVLPESEDAYMQKSRIGLVHKMCQSLLKQKASLSDMHVKTLTVLHEDMVALQRFLTFSPEKRQRVLALPRVTDPWEFEWQVRPGDEGDPELAGHLKKVVRDLREFHLLVGPWERQVKTDLLRNGCRKAIRRIEALTSGAFASRDRSELRYRLENLWDAADRFGRAASSNGIMEGDEDRWWTRAAIEGFPRVMPVAEFEALCAFRPGEPDWKDRRLPRSATAALRATSDALLPEPLASEFREMNEMLSLFHRHGKPYQRVRVAEAIKYHCQRFEDMASKSRNMTANVYMGGVKRLHSDLDRYIRAFERARDQVS